MLNLICKLLLTMVLVLYFYYQTNLTFISEPVTHRDTGKGYNYEKHEIMKIGCLHNLPN